jgi:hypothetical protein
MIRKNRTDWQSSISTLGTSNPQLYKGPSGIRQNEVPRINKDWTPTSVFMLLLFEVIQLLVEVTNTTSSSWTRLTKDGLHCMMWLVRKCTCFYYYCAGGTRSKGCDKKVQVHTRTVFYALLQEHKETGHILPYSEISALKWHQKETW